MGRGWRGWGGWGGGTRRRRERARGEDEDTSQSGLSGGKGSEMIRGGVQGARGGGKVLKAHL